MAVALRKSCRSLNRSPDYLEMIARHRFHEARKENDYEIARRHLKICEQNCSRLESTGDLSVCYWMLGERASNKQYFSKASMFYEKAINMYASARTFAQFQPSLSAIYARYSYALAGKDHLLPQPQTTYAIEDEHRPNPQSHANQPRSINESGTPSPSQSPSQSPELVTDTHNPGHNSISPGITDYKSKIRWPKGVSCQDASQGTVVTGSCESRVGNWFELEEAVEEEGCADIGTQSSGVHVLDEERTDNLISTEKPFVSTCGDNNMESSLIM